MPVCQRIAVRSTKRGPWGRKYGSFCGAESFFLPGEVIFEIVRSRFASSAILESRINGQELTNNCDEFIYYDDLVDDHKSSNRRKPAKKSAKNEPSSAKGTEDKIGEAIQLVLETAEGLQGDKGDQLWGSPGLRNAVYTPYPHREYGRGCLAHVRRHARTATGGLAGDGGRVYGLLADAGRFF